jgi:signal peptidase II
MDDSTRRRMVPFSLSAAILVVDQITKYLVATLIRPGTIGFSALGDFLWIVHAKNLGIAFSIGHGLPATIRTALFIAIPFALVVGVIAYSLRSDEPNTLQRWLLASIVGGGLGNLVDRVFRPEGVVDFISFKFYGLFGFERFPTFNVADMSITVSACLFALVTIVVDARRKR